MKRILLTSVAVIAIGVSSAFAVNTCMKTGTFVGILKKNVDGTSSEHVDATKIWKVVYNYATLTGLAACNDISGTYATPKTNLYTSTGDVGSYCWCKMEPVSAYNKTTGITSYWVYLNGYTDASTCASTCTGACKTAMSSDSTFRGAVFESVW